MFLGCVDKSPTVDLLFGSKQIIGLQLRRQANRLGWLLVCPENKGNLGDLIRTETSMQVILKTGSLALGTSMGDWQSVWQVLAITVKVTLKS